MSLSLKDQLIAAGLVKPDQAKSSSRPVPVPKKAIEKPKPKPQVERAKPTEPSLAELYRARDAHEQKQQQAARAQAEAKAAAKKQRKQQVVQLIAGKALNKKDGEVVRHFEYARKIRRIYVTAEQRSALNAGALGIVQMDGQFMLLEGEIVEQIFAIAPEFVALRGASVEPEASIEGGQDYAAAEYQVPDDLMW